MTKLAYLLWVIIILLIPFTAKANQGSVSFPFSLSSKTQTEIDFSIKRKKEFVLGGQEQKDIPSLYFKAKSKDIKKSNKENDFENNHDEVKHESLVRASSIASDVNIEVHGNLARTNIVQYFYNHTHEWQEGIFTYPLPEKASVEKLVVMVGEKRILGFVAKKQQAKKLYENAKEKGLVAGLVEQHRPNIFKTSVANIPPKSFIAIEVEYGHAVELDQNEFTLRVPLAITPRFDVLKEKELGFLLQESSALKTGSKKHDPKVQDLITRLSLFDFSHGSNSTKLKVNLFPGNKVETLLSPSHDILSTHVSDGAYEVLLKKSTIIGRQDFILKWQLPQNDIALAFAHEEQLEDEYYTHLMVLPPLKTPDDRKQKPRHVTFIIDTSGSMSGPSLAQAKLALAKAIDDLDHKDYFNVLRFSSDTQSLFERANSAGPENKNKALRWVEGLQAGGGTLMMPSLKKALSENAPEDRIKQVVFITDGAVGYEQDLLEFVSQNIGHARLYAVGIGYAPNTHLMKLVAQKGRGSFVFIGDVREVKKSMKELFVKLKAPVLTHLNLEVFHKAAKLVQKNNSEDFKSSFEQTPSLLPDIMIGEPVSVVLKTNKPITHMKLKGFWGEEEYSQNIVLDKAFQLSSNDEDENINMSSKTKKKITTKTKGKTKGISQLYARHKIQELQYAFPKKAVGAELLEGNSSKESRDEARKKAITALGVKYQVVSPYTSLVAVDEEILRPKNAILLSKIYNPNLPKGWALAEYNPAALAREYQLLLKWQKEKIKKEGLQKLSDEDANDKASTMQMNIKNNSIHLPQTNTAYLIKLAMGFVLIIQGCGLAFLRKKK